MSSEELTPEEQAEILRKKQKYRELILCGKITLAPDKAAKLLGPDCLYHLYAQWSSRSRQRRKRRKVTAR